MKNKRRIEITDNMNVPIVYGKRLGLPYYQLCANYKRGKLISLILDPQQTDKMDYYLQWEGKKDRFHIQSYQRLENANIWEHGYCKEHKCATMRFSVPRNAEYLWIQLFGDRISIGFLRDPFFMPIEI